MITFSAPQTQKAHMVLRLFLGLVLFVGIMAIGFVVFGQTPAVPAKPTVVVQQPTQSAWQAFLDGFLKIVLPFLGSVISGLLIVLARRWNIKVKDEQLQSFAKQAAQFAERWASAQLKSTGQKTPGAQKMIKALEFADKLLKESGLGKVATEKITHLIEANLGVAKIEAANIKEAKAKAAVAHKAATDAGALASTVPKTPTT